MQLSATATPRQSDTDTMSFGFNLARDPAAEERRDTARGERVTTDRDFLVAFVTGNGVRIRARHLILRARQREVRTPWWWSRWLLGEFHGLTPWWVSPTRRRSFCDMIRLQDMARLTELVVALLRSGEFTVAQLDDRLATTPLIDEVKHKFAAARTLYLLEVEANATNPSPHELWLMKLLAILEGPEELWLLKYSDVIAAAAAKGHIRALYLADKLTPTMCKLLKEQFFLTDGLEVPHNGSPYDRRMFDTGMLERIVDDTRVSVAAGS